MGKITGDLPWLPFFVKDFETDPVVKAMTNEQVGTYLFLLIDQWKLGYLPDNEKLLAISGRCTLARWRKISPQILLKFSPKSTGKIFNKKLARIRREQVQRRKLAHDRAKLAADTRWKGDA